MSANLLGRRLAFLLSGTTESEGTYHHAARTKADDDLSPYGHDDWLIWNLPDQAALETNQTYHVGLSVRGASANAASLHMTIGYEDAAGKRNWANSPALAIGTSWGRVEGTIVVPSGMKPFAFYVAAYGVCPETWMAAPVLSLGSAVCLASSAHTPYATQDHVSVTYATKASLKVTDDSIKAEVSARAQTDRNVADLSSRLTQTANSLTSEISDRRTAITTVTGLANAAQSTADAAKSSASNAVSTANSASTSAANAVETANAASSAASSASTAAGKASTDAAAAVKTANSASSTASSAATTANSAKSTANAASSTANAAQSTADGAAKQANLYTIGLGDAGSVAKWIHLGTLTSAGDASSATIAIVFGDGYNGSASQNSALTITIKDGWQSTPSATSACGVTAMRENCDDALVDVLAQSATVYDVWVYAPWAYSNGRYSISGQYAAWQHSGATQKAEPATSATQVCLACTNLLDGVKPEITQYGSMTDGVITSSTPKDGWKNVAAWPLPGEAFAENQTMHIGISAKWHGKAATTGVAYAAVKYADAAGSTNNADIPISGITTEWKRFSLSAVIPSGMHLVDFHISGDHLDASYDATSFVLSYGSPVKQDVAYRLADATKAQTMATENQSSIKQLSTSITAEVTARTKTDRMVSEVSSRLTQTADGFSASIDRLSDTDKKVNSWFGFGADSSGNPQLTMGSSTSPVVGVYTNAGLAYKSQSGATLLELDGASRSSTMPHVHADDVSMGNWQWMPTQNGTHFTLMWIGG